MWTNADMAAAAPIQDATPAFNQAGFAPLVKEVKPAVVNIAATGFATATRTQQISGKCPNIPEDSPFGDMMPAIFQHRHNQGVPEHAMGSGFIIDPAGYIVTNNHVIDRAERSR